MTLASNTMSRFTNLVRLDRLPDAVSGSHLTLRNNLIMGVAGDAWVWIASHPSNATTRPSFEGSDGNVCRPDTVTKGVGDTVIRRKTIAFGYIDVSVGGGTVSSRYKKTGDTAPLLTAGAGGEPVGVPPLD